MNKEITQTRSANQEQIKSLIFQSRKIVSPYPGNIPVRLLIISHINNSYKGAFILKGILDACATKLTWDIQDLAYHIGVSERTIRRWLTWLCEHGLLAWRRRWYGTNIFKLSTWWLKNKDINSFLRNCCSEKKLTRILPADRLLSRIISPTVLGFILTSTSDLTANVRRRINIEDYIYKNSQSRGSQVTPREFPEGWGENLTKQYPVIDPSDMKDGNNLSRSAFEEMLCSVVPCVVAETTERAPLTPQQEYTISLKQESTIEAPKHGVDNASTYGTQSHSRLHQGDKRDNANLLGTDKALWIPRASNSFRPESPAEQPSGFQPFRSVIQSGLRSLQGKFTPDKLQESGLPERDLPDAARRAHDGEGSGAAPKKSGWRKLF